MKLETGKTIGKVNETKSLFLEKINRKDSFLDKLAEVKYKVPISEIKQDISLHNLPIANITEDLQVNTSLST